jgi:hypothetical protein
MMKRISRQALYELVWAKPMREAASENDISDVRLAKICRGAGIPVPPQGHWNKVRAGKRTIRIALPPRPPGVPDELTFGHSHHWEGSTAEPTDDTLSPPVFEEELECVLARIREQIGTVLMPKSLSSPHPLVDGLFSADEVRRQKQLTQNYSWNEPLFDSPFEKRRLKILNAILVALARAGHKPSIRGKEGRDLGVTIGRQHVSFDLDAAAWKKSQDWRYSYHVLPKFPPNEKLKFEIHTPAPEPDKRWLWTDDDQKLEDQLTEIVVNLIYAGEVGYRQHTRHIHQWRVQQAERQREELRRQKEEAERQERIRFEREARERVQRLFQEANNWRQAS